MARLVTGITVIVLGICAAAFSFTRSIPVYEEDLDADDFAVYEEISEYALVIDATFTGVFRSAKTGRLITAYDRSQIQDRPACPT